MMFAVVIVGLCRTFEGVSLNRCEQQIFDYIESNRDERHFWEYKVRDFATKYADLSSAASVIDSELWRYYVERSGAVADFRRAAEREGLRRVSMRNLAEYLLRLWVMPMPKMRKAPPPIGD